MVSKVDDAFMAEDAEVLKEEYLLMTNCRKSADTDPAAEGTMYV